MSSAMANTGEGTCFSRAVSLDPAGLLCVLVETAAAPVENEGCSCSSYRLDQIQALCFDEQHGCAAGAGRRYRLSVIEASVQL